MTEVRRRPATAWCRYCFPERGGGGRAGASDQRETDRNAEHAEARRAGRDSWRWRPGCRGSPSPPPAAAARSAPGDRLPSSRGERPPAAGPEPRAARSPPSGRAAADRSARRTRARSGRARSAAAHGAEAVAEHRVVLEGVPELRRLLFLAGRRSCRRGRTGGAGRRRASRSRSRPRATATPETTRRIKPPPVARRLSRQNTTSRSRRRRSTSRARSPRMRQVGAGDQQRQAADPRRARAPRCQLRQQQCGSEDEEDLVADEDPEAPRVARKTPLKKRNWGYCPGFRPGSARRRGGSVAPQRASTGKSQTSTPRLP